MDWIIKVFESPEFGIAVLPAAFLLGMLTAVSSGCNLGIIAAVAGYAGSRDTEIRPRDAWITSGCFFIGVMLSLAILGMLAGYLGKLGGAEFGRYGMILVGFLSIFFGLVALDFVPFKIPSVNLSGKKRKVGLSGSILFGTGVGAASLTCALACSGPLLPMVLAMATARGEVGWGAMILSIFAVGYSLPLGAIMLGIGLGRLTSFSKKAMKPIRVIAGIILIFAGIWLLYSV